MNKQETMFAVALVMVVVGTFILACGYDYYLSLIAQAY